MMYKQLLLGFIIGSSVPIFFLFFLGFKGKKIDINNDNCVYNILNKNNDDELYFLYTLIAPIYLGIMSALGIFLHKYFKFNLLYSFFIIILLSSIIVSLFITICEIYRYDKKQLNKQYLNIIIYHSIIYLFVGILYNLIKD